MIRRYCLEQMGQVWSDESKFSKMLQIEVLTCQALAQFGVIPPSSFLRIKKKARFNIARIEELEKKTNHDVVAFVNNVGEYIGSDAQYLHRGLTSSDVVDSVFSLQLRESADILLKRLAKLRKTLARKAQIYRNTVCIGRTHGVHAEPLTLGLKFALWFDEMGRCQKRLLKAKKEVSVIKLSGAVGTYSHLDPKIERFVAGKLSLKPIIATQVISRDIHAEFMLALGLTASSIEKIATEIRHLQKTEVREVEEPFKSGQKGSSAMPHKRNPILSERLCGLARIVRSYSQPAFENVALWHERDISHSSTERIMFPDACQLLDYMLSVCDYILTGLLVYPANMLANITKTRGLIFSQRLLIKLMEKGAKRSVAYDIIQRLSMQVWKDPQASFFDLVSNDSLVSGYLTKKEISACFNLNYYLRNIRSAYKLAGLK